MRKCTCLSAIACFLCFFFGNNSFGQATAADSSSQQTAMNNTLRFFFTSIGEQSSLYNGTEYYSYDPTIKGNAYYAEVNAFTPGSIYYDGTQFTNIPMLYDIYSDQVVVLLYNHFSKLALVKSKVLHFDYLDHHFVNIDVDTLNENTIIKSGFYDELYGGKIQILAKRSKNIQTRAGGTSAPESYFNPIKDYYIRKNNIYYTINSQGALFDVLNDKKKILKQYIKANKIKYRKNPEEAMVKIASYYDQLSK